MKLLAIQASPKETGNLAQMLNHAIEEAKGYGCEVEYVNLYQQTIQYCRGCMACKKTGECIINDDVVHIRESLINCDIVIIACPTYFANVTAPLKALFDRLVGTVMDDNESMIPKPKLSKKQKYILLTACNTPFPFNILGKQSTGCLKAMKEVLHISGMTCMGKVTFAGTRGKVKPPIKVMCQVSKCVQKSMK